MNNVLYLQRMLKCPKKQTKTKMKKLALLIIAVISSITVLKAQNLPFPEDTIAYNDRFNNRQWVQYDQNGNLHITYTGQYGTDSHTRNIYYVTNESGSFVTTQLTDTGLDNNYSSFVFDDEGFIHMVDLQYSTSDLYQLKYRNNVDGDFSDPVWITSGNNKATPHIAVGSDNIAHFVYYSFVSGVPDYAYYISYDINTGVIGPEIQLGSHQGGPSGENDIRVAVDSDDYVHIIFRAGGTLGGTLRYFNNTSGSMQEETTPVTESMEYPAMVIDANDRMHVLYRRNSDKRMAYFTREADGTFSNVVSATPPNIGNPAFFRTIDVDDEGRFYFTYQNSVASGPIGFFMVSGLDGVFEEPLLVWDDPEDLYLTRNSSSVAARGDGEVAVFYAPAASRDGNIVCDIFMKRGLLFADAEAIIEVSHTSINYGEVETGTMAEQIITIYNLGPVALDFGLQFSDDVFFSPTDGPTTVPPYGNLNLSIAFYPEEEGIYEGIMTITSNAVNEPELEITLSGEGVDYYAYLDVDESLHFYGVPVNTTAEGMAGAVNIGNADLIIHHVEIAGDDAGVFDFDLVEELPITLPPGHGASFVNVFFSPDAVGSYAASLVFHSNSIIDPVSMGLNGEAIEATYMITFRVDLSPAIDTGVLQEFNPDIHQVFISGSMNGWEEPGTNPETQLMEKVSDDPLIYEKVFELTGGTYEYKYFTDYLGEGWEGGERPIHINRMVQVTQDMVVEDIFNPDTQPSVEDLQAYISVYPNPARNFLNIESDILIEHIRLINIQGQTIQNTKVNATSVSINTEGLRNGMYLLKVHTESGAFTKRVQVER